VPQDKIQEIGKIEREIIEKGPLKEFVKVVEDSFSGRDEKAEMIKFLKDMTISLLAAEELKDSEELRKAAYDTLNIFSWYELGPSDEDMARMRAWDIFYKLLSYVQGYLIERFKGAIAAVELVKVDIVYDKLVGLKMVIRSESESIYAEYLIAVEVLGERSIFGTSFNIKILPLAAALSVGFGRAGAYIDIYTIAEVLRRWGGAR
jgi:hypothetical protein